MQCAYDLMCEQARKGHKIYALVCGDTLFRGKVCRIKKAGSIGDISVFRLTNPLTPTLIYGVSDPGSQHRVVNIDEKQIMNFIRGNEISILHIHTMQGLHLDIVNIFKREGVKIVYTTHDFHGICPHYDLINDRGELCSKVLEKNCVGCNLHEPSDIFLRVVNSDIYYFIKRTGILKLITKGRSVRKQFGSNGLDIVSMSTESKRQESFRQLLRYYREYFGLVDQFQFNSSQTRSVFEKLLGTLSGYVIPVVTSGVCDDRKPVNIHDVLKFGFIGNLNEYKGFPLLKRVLSQIHYMFKNDFILKVYGADIIGVDEECTFIEYCPPYDYSELSGILNGMDCLIVPSKWYETFSLVTLEALSHGLPVIVSDHVGAKDIVSEFTPELIFSNEEDLKRILIEILDDKRQLLYYSEQICKKDWKYNIESFSESVIGFYNE